MKLSTSFILSIVLFATFMSCSKEHVPSDIGGRWNAELYEIVDCIDTSENLFVNTTIDPCYNIGADIVCIESFYYEFDTTTNNTYKSELIRTVNGATESITDQGNYTIENLNRLVLCNPACDSLFVVRTGNRLEIVNQDTLSGCNSLFRGIRMN